MGNQHESGPSAFLTKTRRLSETTGRKRNICSFSMPAEYKIDKLSGGVFSSAYGIITDQDAYAHQNRLRNDPEFNPGFFQLFDFAKVTQADISTEAIHLLAERNPFGQGSHRAFVVPSDLMYGLSRMFQILTDHHQDKLSVFRDIHEARKYLSLK